MADVIRVTPPLSRRLHNTWCHHTFDRIAAVHGFDTAGPLAGVFRIADASRNPTDITLAILIGRRLV